MEGPKAPKDAVEKKNGFYIMNSKQIAGSIQPNGSGTQFVYLNNDRLISSARIDGNIQDEKILQLLKTTEGFRTLVHSIGVKIETEDQQEMVDFVLQMYGKTDMYGSGTNLRMSVKADGIEQMLELEHEVWSEDDDIPGQMRFEFAKAGILAIATVTLYVYDGYDIPEQETQSKVDFSKQEYQQMLQNSILQIGNCYRLKNVINRAKAGEDITVGFIGGSITQGAGASPINTQCYAYKTYEGICKLLGKSIDSNIHYCKAGVGGTPSELGMLRYERDMVIEGEAPDVVVVEFAVNDEGDETKGECYDSLIRKIWNLSDRTAIILLFAVFANDWNLQERLGKVGEIYHLPMVSVKDCVVSQFYKKQEEGRVISKSQFFYDSFHPTNDGHTVMADCLLTYFRQILEDDAEEEPMDLLKIAAPLGSEFQNIRLLDRNTRLDKIQDKDIQNIDIPNNEKQDIGIQIDAGDFDKFDTELQNVERDYNLFGTPCFPNNWMHQAGTVSFKMEIECSALVLIGKDSGSPSAGCVEVYADGEKVLTVDPKQNGWTHCNALICFRGRPLKQYQIEVKMAAGEEDKEFTILGFGYVR